MRGCPGPGSIDYSIVDATDRDVPTAMAGLITPGFFETFQVPLRDGRDFRLSETRRDGDPVVIVNRSFVDRHLSDGGAVGRQIRLWNDAEEEPAPWLRVVGVVDDVDGGVNPFAGPFMISQSCRLPRPPRETVPVPIPPSGRAMRAR